MPRQARIVIPGIVHHITQRGNYRQKIFDKDIHYKQYAEWINEYIGEFKLDILAYCLMSNHVHFLAIPKRKDDLANVFKSLHVKYSHYINKQRKAKGHLWQGRFYSCLLDEKHLYRAIRYIENNPVRAKLVKQAWNYNYSSALDHVGEREKSLINLSKYKTINKKDWKEYLKETDSQITEEIRLKTNRGLAVGTKEFILDLEKKLKRSLECRKWGRPKKST